MQYLVKITGHVYTKKQQVCGENELTVREKKLQTALHFSGDFSEMVKKHTSLDYRYNVLLAFLSPNTVMNMAGKKLIILFPYTTRVPNVCAEKSGKMEHLVHKLLRYVI